MAPPDEPSLISTLFLAPPFEGRAQPREAHHGVWLRSLAMGTGLGVAAIIFLIVSAAPVLGGAAEDCSQGEDQDRRIRGCTAIIRGEQKADAAAAYINRGAAWSDKGDYDRAIADADQAVRLNPRDPRAFALRGTAWSIKGDYGRAVADYDQAIRLDPKSSELYALRGTAWSDKGDYGRAIADYDQAILFDPKFSESYALRGSAWLHKGDYGRAIADCDQAIKLSPQTYYCYLLRGQAHFALGDFAAAGDDFKRASDLGNSYAMLWRFFIRAHMKQDGYTELGLKREALNALDWPVPIIDFYLGKLSLKKLNDAADTPSKKCEVNFYVAELHISRGETVKARSRLEIVVAGCPKSFNEYIGAVVELKRISETSPVQ